VTCGMRNLQIVILVAIALMLFASAVRVSVRRARRRRLPVGDVPVAARLEEDDLFDPWEHTS